MIGSSYKDDFYTIWVAASIDVAASKDSELDLAGNSS